MQHTEYFKLPEGWEMLLWDDHKLKMHRDVTKFVSLLMKKRQKTRLGLSRTIEQKKLKEDENFLWRIKTGAKSWIYNFDIETKVESSQ